MSVAGFDSDTWSDDPFLPSKFSGFFKKRNLNNETCSEGVTKSGAWCLQSSSPPNYVKLDKSSYELPMGHVRADRAIANYILSLMLVGSNVIDLGAGVGQYGKFIIDKNPKLELKMRCRCFGFETQRVKRCPYPSLGKSA